MLLWYCNARLKFFQKIRVEDKNVLWDVDRGSVREGDSWRWGREGMNRGGVDIENIGVV